MSVTNNVTAKLLCNSKWKECNYSIIVAFKLKYIWLWCFRGAALVCLCNRIYWDSIVQSWCLPIVLICLSLASTLSQSALLTDMQISVKVLIVVLYIFCSPWTKMFAPSLMGMLPYTLSWNYKYSYGIIDLRWASELSHKVRTADFPNAIVFLFVNSVVVAGCKQFLTKLEKVGVHKSRDSRTRPWRGLKCRMIFSLGTRFLSLQTILQSSSMRD